VAAIVVAAPVTAEARNRSPREPVFSPWRLVAVGTAVVLGFRAVHPIFDIDLYWHIPVGNEIIATHSVRHAGAAFAYTLPGHSWVTTQWLSEVALATVYNLGGFTAIAVLRLILCLALMGALGWQLLRGHGTIWAPLFFAVAAYISAAYFQERPQLFSLFFVVWLAGVMRAELVDGRQARWWSVVSISWVWANVHGLWIMVPACYALLAIGRLLEARRRERSWTTMLHPAGVALAAILVAALTPAGPRLLLSPISFASATKQIQEWQPTNFHNGVAVGFALLVLVAVVAWVRGGSRVSSSEMVYVGGLTAFAMFSMRDVPPAAILLAPVVLHRVESSFPRLDRIDSVRERRLVAGVATMFLLLGAAGIVAKSFNTPTIPPTVPRTLAERIADDPGPHRVLDDYNASGAVIFWSGPLEKVAIDGRADRYGKSFIARYSQMMLTMGDWQHELASFDPDYALLDKRAPLARALTAQGWAVVGYEDKWVLLHSAVR
jgi:hypothetical protein